ncbi:hypothetical protein GCM10009801_13590 [Streptomyces albiaxialis]|uniref:Histidine kinase/HSP90-like ATPase domain-containing protein n=1 Tax=Streptomyces albiaxialis TaxID=329523 RepID=A0ABP5HAS9_9ACTN
MAAPHDALPLDHRSDGALIARPHRDAFYLPARDSSVSEARSRVLDRLREWHVDEESCADAQLLMSELFTNAVQHTDSNKISCELWVIGVRLRLEVTDEGGGCEHICPDCADGTPEGDGDGESGRGLLLVSVLADDWGIRPGHPAGQNGQGVTGHAVWAELECDRTFD